MTSRGRSGGALRRRRQNIGRYQSGAGMCRVRREQVNKHHTTFFSDLSVLRGRFQFERAESVLVNNIPLTIPQSFEGILPTQPSELNFPFEPETFGALASLIKPGATAFDVGSSYGILATLLAKLLGPRGRVYAFEANSHVMPRARLLARRNGVLRRVCFVNACIGETSGGEVEFNVLPEYQSVASTRNPQIRAIYHEATTVRVPLLALDDFCAQVASKPPCMIKIDIEGGEWCALQGARRLLEEVHPDLVIETHGLEINGIGGSLGDLCNDLRALGYPLFDLHALTPIGPEEYAAKYASRIGHLLASTKLSEPGVIPALQSKLTMHRSSDERARQLWDDLARAREAVNRGLTSEAEGLLRGNPHLGAASPGGSVLTGLPSALPGAIG